MSAERPPQPVVVLISGRGSNMRALVEQSDASAGAAVAAHSVTAHSAARSYRVALVLSDQPSAAGLTMARRLGIESRAVPKDPLSDRVGYDRRLAAAIDEVGPTLIVLAGFMRILSAEFVERFAGRILNIHPSLLPRHTGLHTHRNALAAGDTHHGATVHFVTKELDGGPPVMQARVAIHADDDEQTLAARVQALEHVIYPLAVRWFCEGRLRCRDGQAWLDGEALGSPLIYDAGGAGTASRDR